MRHIAKLLLLMVFTISVANAQPIRELTPKEKSCRFWRVSLPNQGVTYIHGPTMTALGKIQPDFNYFNVDDRTRLNAAVATQAAAEVCMATHLSGIGGNACDVKCIASGVESELAGEPIRQYIEAGLSKAVSEQVNKTMADFLNELKKTNDEGRQLLVDSLIRELPNHPDLVQALKEAMRKAPQKAAPAAPR